jgi:predicted TIM-barrel fold metal-dependent hydrolase
MIIDSHAHAFPPMGGASGHRTRADHMPYVQHLLMSHHQPVRRAEDNAVARGQTLNDGRDFSLGGLTEVDFRGGDFGKLAWTSSGDDLSLQYLPPTLTRLHAPPELMIAQMDYAGVDKAVLQTGHAYGRLNGYLGEAVQKYPERFWALAMVDEWRVDEAGQRRTLDRAINEQGLHALWFQSSNLRQHGRQEPVDDPVFEPFWDHVRDIGIPVFWLVTSVTPGRDSYMVELAAFRRWVEKYPEIPVLFTHGLPLFRFMDEGIVSIPEEAWDALKAPNVTVEILIPIFQGSIWEYPYTPARPIIREYYRRFGPDRLTWGSDMPNVERHCTYKQSLDYLRVHCDFIRPDDMDKICGGNVARMFGRE